MKCKLLPVEGFVFNESTKENFPKWFVKFRRPRGEVLLNGTIITRQPCQKEYLEQISENVFQDNRIFDLFFYTGTEIIPDWLLEYLNKNQSEISVNKYYVNFFGYWFSDYIKPVDKEILLGQFEIIK